MRTLRRLHAPATFFQVGATEHYFTDAEALQREDPLVTVAVHTLGHRRLDRLSRARPGGGDRRRQRDPDRRGQSPARRCSGRRTARIDQTTLELLRERAMTMVLWSVDSHDYLRPGVDAIVSRVLTDAKPGAIILLHDAGGDRSQTIQALPRIVLGLRRRHYTLVGVPQLLEDAPPPLAQPKLGVGAG